MIATAVMAGMALAGCGSQGTTAISPPVSPASPSASSTGAALPYDQIDLTKWHDAMVGAGAHDDVDLQATYAATVKLCNENGAALATHLATRGNETLERVAFKYVCPTRLKLFNQGSQVAD